MRHPEGSRIIRRRRARQELLARAMTPQLPEHLQAGRPKYGVPRSPDEQRAFNRQRAIEKFGEKADERQVDRRKSTMSPREVEEWLKRNNIYGGDRRKDERRRR